jgi:hypothetical protein
MYMKFGLRKNGKQKKYDECPSAGPFETGNPNNGSKGYFYGHMSLEDAFYEFSGNVSDMFRPAYKELSYDNEGETLDEFLSIHGEHPKELIDFIEKYEDQYYEL